MMKNAIDVLLGKQQEIKVWKCNFSQFLEIMNDRPTKPTDRPTNRPTDRPTHQQRNKGGGIGKLHFQ